MSHPAGLNLMRLPVGRGAVAYACCLAPHAPPPPTRADRAPDTTRATGTADAQRGIVTAFVGGAEEPSNAIAYPAPISLIDGCQIIGI